MTNQNSKMIASLILILMLGITSVPTASYANGNKNDEKHEEKKAEQKAKKDDMKTRKACRQIFWKLFTVGSLKNSENVNLFIECLRPFGFEARFTGTATTTPPIHPAPVDTTKPAITNVSTLIGTSTLKVSWHTDENASSKLYYSTSTSINTATSTSFVENLAAVKNHSLLLTGLVPQTSYYLIVESKDNSGNVSTSLTFHTLTNN